MKRHHFLTVLFLLFSLSLKLEGQSVQLSVESFPYMSQLPSNSVQRVYQDKEGFLWFGTLDGLCRYDGYSIRSFRSDMNNPNLLSNNDIQSIVEDGENNLWIGTKQGLNRLNKHTLRITPFEENTFKGDRINSLAVDAQGAVWIGTSRGLYRYDTKQHSLHIYVHDPSDKKSIPGTSVNYIYQDNHHNLWIMFWEAGLCRYQPETDNFQRYPKVGAHNNPFRLYQDKQDHYWIGTWGDGVCHFDPKADEATMYTFHTVKNMTGKQPETTFFSLVQDDKYGYLWFMTLTGLYVMKHEEDGSLTPIDISAYLTSSSRLYSEIVKDKDNNLWVGAFSEGVIFINFERPPVQNYTLDIVKQRMGFSPSLKALSEDRDGLVWLGLNRYGLCLYNKVDNTAIMHSDMPSLKGLQEIETINYIREIKHRNEHWISCNHQFLYVLKKKGGRAEYVRSVDVNTGNDYISSGDKVLFEDSKGNVWVGLYGGVIKVTPEDEIVAVTDLPAVTDITEDADGTIWLASEQVGLCRLTPAGLGYKTTMYDKYTEGLNTSNVQSVAAHPSGLIWIGTKEGRVITYDKNKGLFVDVSHLCAMTGEGILNMLTDNWNNVWISTNKKVTRYNPKTESSTTYSVFDNLAVNSFIGGAFSQSASGEVLFGGNRGFCAFLPVKEKNGLSIRSTNVIITDVKVHNVSVFDSGSTVGYDYVRGHLTLPYTANNLEIEFSTLNYAFPNKVQYAYKMEGVDNDWNYVATNRRFANYNNLRKGTYRFQLKATDENGLWSEVITSLVIEKKPALYETWWAQLVYLVVFLGMLFILYRFSVNRFRLRNELKYARIEKEKSEELTQTKLRYFTNISHELLTPLTIMSCLIDDLELTHKGKFWQHDVMKINVNRLKRLLQQILDFRKVESGSMKLKVAEGDLVPFVNHICQYNFKPLAKEKQLHFSMVSLEPTIMGWFDAEKLDSVLFNLLSNAFKYTQAKGSVQVTVEQLQRDEGRFARITVSDTGRGIAPSDISHIFTRFYSNDPTNSVENHGIGLTLTKEMLELHHGSIRVESQLGQGSIFTVEFPLDAPFYADAERVGLSVSPPDVDLVQLEITSLEALTEPEEAEVSDICLLIVEDNAQLRSLMEKIFSKRYHTYQAANGEEALRIVDEHPIDVVVSDIIMPGMDGLELCRRLKGNVNTSHIGVLLLTAKNSVDDRIDSYNAGADGYLSKPFELKVLDARLSSLIKNRQHKSERFKTTAELSISALEFPSLDEKFLENAIAVIEEHLAEPDFDLDMFSGKLSMSKSSLYRKIKSLTGMSPVEFTKNIRLKHACRMLSMQAGNVSDIAYSVGFADPKYFTSCFKAAFGVTPTEYVKQHKQADTSPTNTEN